MSLNEDKNGVTSLKVGDYTEFCSTASLEGANNGSCETTLTSAIQRRAVCASIVYLFGFYC